MKITSVRKDKTACQLDGDKWFVFSQEVKDFVKDKDIWKADAVVEFSDDGKFITKMTIQEPPKQGAKKVETSFGSKSDVDIRSFAVSYAKDVWIAGKIDKEEVIDIAEKFFNYIKTGV